MLHFYPDLVYRREVRRKAWSIDRIAGFGAGAGRWIRSLARKMEGASAPFLPFANALA
jgi:hypothetical protein